MSMTGDEWIAAFADRLGGPPPDAATVDTLLALAGTAAHAPERPRRRSPATWWAGPASTPTRRAGSRRRSPRPPDWSGSADGSHHGAAAGPPHDARLPEARIAQGLRARTTADRIRPGG